MSDPATEEDQDPESTAQFGGKIKQKTIDQIQERYPHALNDSERVRLMAHEVLEMGED